MDAETTAAVRAVIEQIRQNNRRYVTAILIRAFQSILPGSVVLLALAFISNYVIGTVNATFGNRLYTSAASAITLLVTILAARAVWLWANRRLQGWTLIRTIGEVNGELRKLERAVQAGEITDPERITTTVQDIWETYVAAMRAAGLLVE